jgi:hypothetical protein
VGNEGQFPIQITGDASSLAAASQVTNTALESNKIKLAELTPQQKALTTEMQAGAKASGDAGRQLNEHSEKMKFLGVHTGELKKLTRELGQEFPVAGMAARLMINPIVGGLTLAIMVFGAAKSALDAWNKALDEAAARNASHDFLPGIEAKKAALDAARASAAEFAVALENIGAAEDRFKTSVSQAIDKLHEFVNAQAEVNSAAEAKEMAETDLKQKQGKLTEVGGIKARAEIRERYRKQQDDLKTKGEQDELGFQQSELEQDKQSQDSLKAAAKAAREKVAGIKATRSQFEHDLEEGNKKANAEGTGDYDKELAKINANADTGLNWLESRLGGDTSELSPHEQADYDAQLRQRQAQMRFNEANRAAIRALDTGPLPTAEGAASVAEARAKSNAERIAELERTLPGKRAVIDIREKKRAEAGQYKDETTEIEKQKQEEDIKQRLLREYADAQAHGTGLSPEWYRQMGEFSTSRPAGPPRAGGSAGDANELASLNAQLAAAQKQIAAERQAFIDHISASRGLDQATLQKLATDTVKMKADTKTIADLEKRVREIEGRPPRT